MPFIFAKKLPLHQKTKAHLALLATNIFFAINFTAVKFLINNSFVKPFGLNLIRVAVTTALLWIIYLFKQQRAIIKKTDLFRFFLCALTGIAINQLLFIKGLSLTYSIHASLLMLTTPILITVIAAFVLREKLTLYKLIGLALGISGAAILIMARDHSGNAQSVLLGDVLVIINVVSYTIYFILVRPLMSEYNPVTVIRMIFSIGLLMMLPFCWKEFSETPWQLYNLQEYALLGLIVIGGTFLAYLFNVFGIKILGSSVAGAYIYVQPVFAAAIAMIFLGEPLSLYKVMAALCIFGGVYLATKPVSNAK